MSRLQQLGLDGPFFGSHHQHMKKNGRKITLPNPHQGDISAPLLARILKQANISLEEWEKSE